MRGCRIQHLPGIVSQTLLPIDCHNIIRSAMSTYFKTSIEPRTPCIRYLLAFFMCSSTQALEVSRLEFTQLIHRTGSYPFTYLTAVWCPNLQPHGTTPKGKQQSSLYGSWPEWTAIPDTFGNLTMPDRHLALPVLAPMPST